MKMKKLVAIFALIAMICSFFSVGVFAAEEEEAAVEVEETAVAVEETVAAVDGEGEEEGNTITEHGEITAEGYFKYIDGKLVDVSDAPCAYDQVIWRIFYEDGWYQESTVSIPHEWDEGEVTKEATCTEAGEVLYTCTVCGATKTEVIEPLGHLWGSEQDPFDPFWGRVIKEATCTETGLAQDECVRCGETREKYRTIDMLEHEGETKIVIDSIPHCYNEQKDGRVPADELYEVESEYLQGGETILMMYGYYHEEEVCKNCGKVLEVGDKIQIDVDEYAELINNPNYDGHDWDGWIVEIAPTCLEAGQRVRVCLHCGLKNVEEMPALGHAYAKVRSYLADCFNAYDKFVCTACGDTIYGYRVWDAQAKVWDYSNTITEEEFEADPTEVPTYDTESHMYPAPAQKLIDAGVFTIDYATFQKWTDTSDLKKASKDFWVIEKEGGKDTIVNSYIDDFEAPTCTEPGYVDVLCLYYDTVEGHDDTDIVTFVVPALGHDWSAWEIEHLPGDGDNVEGTWVRTCQRCGTIDRVSGKYTPEACAEDGHTYVETDRVAATCTEAGKIEYLCTTCGDVKTEAIEALGHTWDEGVVTAATCDEDGFITYTCTVCGATKVEAGEAKTGHDYVAEVIREAACGVEGYTKYTCAVCGDAYFESTAALEHDYKAESKDATCTEAGYTKDVCALCGDEKNVVEIAALGHTAADEVIENEVAATYEAAGSYDKVVYCSVCGEELSRETVEVPQLVEPAYELDASAISVASDGVEGEAVVASTAGEADFSGKYVLLYTTWENADGDTVMIGTCTKVSADGTVELGAQAPNDSYIKMTNAYVVVVSDKSVFKTRNFGDALIDQAFIEVA